MSTVRSTVVNKLVIFLASSINKTELADRVFQNFAPKLCSSLSPNLLSFSIKNNSNNSVQCCEDILQTEQFFFMFPCILLTLTICKQQGYNATCFSFVLFCDIALTSFTVSDALSCFCDIAHTTYLFT